MLMLCRVMVVSWQLPQWCMAATLSGCFGVPRRGITDCMMAAAAVAPLVPALPWMRVPTTIEPGTGVNIHDVPWMHPDLKAAFLTQGAPSKSTIKQQRQTYKELFPVQAAVWTELGGGMRTAHDVCIAAPTGSGKTLAYALPVINCLAWSLPSQDLPRHCLRALVVLPTRGLAQQVAAVMAPLCAAVGLNLRLAAAQAGLVAEADSLTGLSQHSMPAPLSLDQLLQSPSKQAQESALQLQGSATSLSHGALGPSVDVLVATPGRLTAHMAATPGFSLAGLQFLVVDEADRLLRQSYQDWLPHVISILHSSQHHSMAWHRVLNSTGPHEALSTVAKQTLSGAARCVKLIVSATLTRDPSKLQRLALHCPRFVAVGSSSQTRHRYQLPKALQEFQVLCSAARKPITLLALLQQLQGASCVVFASSLDTTHKLYLLLQAVLNELEPAEGQLRADQVVECSGHKAAAGQRAAALARFKAGHARVLVASDMVTRGMDFDGVEVVINYDAPVYAKTYVHRAGRTARAGRAGRVFTLLKDEDLRHFKAMLHKADNSYVSTYKLPPGAADTLSGAVTAALAQVSALLAAEAEDDRKRAAPGAARGVQK